MKSKCKEYQVNSEIVKCLENKHSKTCLAEQKLKEEYPSAKEIIWLPAKQNWSISFDYLDKDHQTKLEKAKKQEEPIELLENEDE